MWPFTRKPKLRRLELRFLSYEEADRLLRETRDAFWRIAPEEDRNRILGMVYLERVERP